MPNTREISYLAQVDIGQHRPAVAPSVQREMASEYRVPDVVFKSWLHSLAYVRNLCAHHKRVWNRVLAIKPIIPHKWTQLNLRNDRIYSVLVILSHCLSQTDPAEAPRWRADICKLLASRPDRSLARMGAPQGFEYLEPWTPSPAPVAASRVHSPAITTR
jgi:abortive infection bacteriophage resistance protein